MANHKGNKSTILDLNAKKDLVNKHFNEHIFYKKLSMIYNISYSAARRMFIDWEIYREAALISKNGKHNKHNGKIKINSKIQKIKK
ncbi:hypothetical protein [Spiroplasma tabanidicola]|uniref:Uncharacterized protein n=1 Tax=Spiroplasma tabanidicola TaxID=324079 RepID=A0A6I6CDL0_9MOLU|nr:hypothetical protein [Spiroplasma tabanidicola]QGS52064.1 hypothetical protein STABA_v1c07070 [Spiroplasma tabanidicola]